MTTGLSGASGNSGRIEDAEREQGSGHDLSRAAYLLTWIAKRITVFLRFARYAYLLRVPIIIAALLLAFPFAALLQKSPLRVLLQNLFLLDGASRMWPWPTFWSTMAALVLSWSILLTTRIVLLNCKDRFNLPLVMTAADLRGWPFFAIVILALPTIVGQFTQQGDFRPSGGFCTKCVLAVVAGALCSYMVAFVALWLAVLLAPPHTQGSALTFPCLSPMRNWLDWADRHHVLPKGISAGLWVRENLPCSLWSGYVAGDGFVWSGHWLALVFGSATLSIYFCIEWWHGRSLGETSRVTALTFILLLLLNANWVLSFAGFFLDRFRIPILVPLALLAVISGNNRASDHYFHVEPVPIAADNIIPGDVLRARRGRPIVVIATAGGGIQAAAWTAQVLAGLEQEYDLWNPGQRFSDSVTVISSVSGGAAGSMFYLNLFDPAVREHFHSERLAGLVSLASLPSLDDVAWALVYHDIPRVFFLGGAYDRGRALEETWSKRAQVYSKLSEWRTGVAQGWRPVCIFNSTVAETGEPITFSTTGWIPDQSEAPRRRDFFEMYRGEDLAVVTAVRLAATFPYVTPAARPDTPSTDGYHMIDGGYYDNYGVFSLLTWLDEGLSALHQDCYKNVVQPAKKAECESSSLPRILVLQIRSFPADEEAQASKRGWAFQLFAPLKGLLSVRTTAQLLRDREALRMFAHRWEPGVAESKEARIQFATFEYGGFKTQSRDKAVNPPLSWAMNPSQIQAIKDDWSGRIDRQDPNRDDPNIDRVHCFFDPGFMRCPGLTNQPE